MFNLEIIGSGVATLKNKYTNNDFKKFVDTSDEWIYSRTGIKTRYFTEDENTSDIGYIAALNAIEDASIDKNEIDLIIVATMTPDNFTPSCACLIQAKLGLGNKKIMAFDINAACSGFVYALEIASNMLENYKCALVIGSEVLSKIIDFTDRNTCVLFGDGAGAIVVKKSLFDKKMLFYSNCIGDLQGKLIAENINKNGNFTYLKMDGKEVFKFAVNAMEKSINYILEKLNIKLDDIDLIIPHQANIRIIEYVCKKLNVSIDKFYMNIAEFGNTSAASIPIALNNAIKEEKIKENSKIILVGFGGGFTYGSCYIEF